MSNNIKDAKSYEYVRSNNMRYTNAFIQGITENRNPKTMDLDLLSTQELVNRVQDEDFIIAEVVKRATNDIANAVDIIVSAIQSGGRLIYFGAGTSGRLGVLDASECPPTFGVDSEVVQAYIAGGKDALTNALENAEDSETLAHEDVKKANISAKDVVVGITASGRTPYVVAAIEKAKELGAKTVGIVNNDGTKLHELCDITICALVGPEAISGSTRMKAGTAQKMILNLLSTCTMVRMGKVYENLMVDLKPTNEKLKERAVSIIATISGAPRHIAEGALVASHYSAKTAIVMVKRKLGRAQAEQLITNGGGSLRKALLSEPSN
jgi:N-acetylmuramic acid 6-phosphate etherase